jgi:hypothetical protein
MRSFTYQLVEGGGGFVEARDLCHAFDRLMGHGIHYNDLEMLYPTCKNMFKDREEKTLKIKSQPEASTSNAEDTKIEKPIAISFNNIMYTVACYALSKNDKYNYDNLVKDIAAVLVRGFPQWSREIEVSRDKVVERLKNIVSLPKGHPLSDIEIVLNNATCSLGSYMIAKEGKTVDKSVKELEDRFNIAFPSWSEQIAKGVFKASERLNRMFND